METFSALLALCARNSLVTGEFPSQRPVVRSFDAFFDLRLNKRLSEQSNRRWFGTQCAHDDVTVMDLVTRAHKILKIHNEISSENRVIFRSYRFFEYCWKIDQNIQI